MAALDLGHALDAQYVRIDIVAQERGSTRVKPRQILHWTQLISSGEQAAQQTVVVGETEIR